MNTYFKYSKSMMKADCINENQVGHLVELLKQKFISPYKIMYMVDQKEADYFKSRNQNNGCCSSSEITIPAGEQTKIQKQLAQLISFSAIKGSLNELMEYCENRYQNIVEKGKQDSLKITAEVEKYLIDNIMAESVNKFIHTKLVTKLAQQSKSLSTDIGLWATPATWYAKYPHVKLEILESQNISQLFNQNYTVIEGKFNNYLTQAFGELLLLEKDGKFEQILWKSTQNPEGNESKILNNPMRYGNLQDEDSLIRNTFRICLLLQSLPFELNMKANCYLTISDSIQAYYYNSAPTQSIKRLSSFKYEIMLPVNVDLQMQVNKQALTVKRGSIVIISNAHEYSFKCTDQKTKDAFIIRSLVSEAQRTN